MSSQANLPVLRGVYCVLSSRSLPYARHAVASLVERSVDNLDVTLITDSTADKAALVQAMQELAVPARHRWQVVEQAEADERAADMLAGHPNIAAFRFGHPCWRKVTDPMLFATPGGEMVILDPDLYFPNRFRFEPTPAEGLLLMHQQPHCLLPHEVVVRAYDQGIRLAHHTDIGVAQVRNRIDLDFLDSLIARLGGKSLPRAMHIESIIWAALAMHMGGGYLDPVHWHCWRNSQWKRVLRRFGASGRTVLRSERFQAMKCFHGGGIAKWWLPEALVAGDLPPTGAVLEARAPLPYEELTRDAYDATQRLKSWARRAGYYRLVKS
jgi:hypothetical protein